jgi:calcium-dependent protein kinase
MGTCCSKLPKAKPYTPQRALITRKTFSKHVFVKLVQGNINENYKIISKLGNGCFGEVKLALHRPSETQRAIKVIPLSEDVNTNMLMAEVNILKTLDHPNIVRIFEVIQDSKSLNIVMEYCSGGELFDKIKDSNGFSENLAANYMLDIVSAVRYCHEAKIVHRDLKPENILFESSEPEARLKIIDFGTSQYVKAKEKMNKFIGTTYYIAPEVIEKNYDEKCDVWSLGVILYIMLCGKPPFYSRVEKEVYEKIKKIPVTFKGGVWSSVSDEAKCLIQKMLRKDPLSRYSIQEVYSDPWIQNRAHGRIPDKPLAESALTNLLNFSAENYLQRITMSYIVTQLVNNSEIEELKKIFQELDRNGDGRLSKDEVQSGCLHYFHKIDLDPKTIIEKCDLDGNGYIDYSEFLAAALNWQKTCSLARLLQAFKAFDQDNNGKISKDELVAILKSSGMSKDELDEIVEIADKNKDGEIDFEEFRIIIQGNRI